MDFLKGQALNVVGLLLSQLLSLVTPTIKNALKSFLEGLYAKAKATPNGFDDALIGMLMALVGVDTPMADQLAGLPGGEEVVGSFQGLGNIIPDNK